MWISPKLFSDQLNAWINRELVSREVRKHYSALSRNNGVPGGGAFHRRKWFCKQRKWSHLQFFRKNRSPRAAILIMKYQFRYWNLGRKKQTAAKGKQRSGNNRRTKQSKRPNVNFSKASTRSSNENAKMQANHTRNQNRKAAEVLLKGLESKLRPVVRTWRNTRRSEHCIWHLFFELLRTQTKPIKFIWHSRLLAQRVKTLQETITFANKRKSLLVIQIQEAL